MAQSAMSKSRVGQFTTLDIGEDAGLAGRVDEKIEALDKGAGKYGLAGLIHGHVREPAMVEECRECPLVVRAAFV